MPEVIKDEVVSSLVGEHKVAIRHVVIDIQTDLFTVVGQIHMA